LRNTKTLRKPAQVRRGAATSRRSTKGPSRSAASLSAQTRPPLPGQGKRGENGYLGYLLRQAQAAARLTLERALADLEVTPPQFVVLTMLKAYPGLSGADLARVALLTPQTIGLIIANLERSGAIGKTPHPVHGRVLQWSLSPRGNTLLAKCRRRAQTLERRLAAGLTPRNEAVVRRWLAGIAARMAT
jgi:DNA-binding MarR family transcriptional regulator